MLHHNNQLMIQTLLISSAEEQIMEPSEQQQPRMLKILIKTQGKDSILEEHLPAEIIKVRLLIHFRMMLVSSSNLNKQLKKKLNSSLTQFSWAKCNLNSNKSITKWQMVFNLKWRTIITVKVVVACNSNSHSHNHSNLEQPCQDMEANSSNNSEACLNKISHSFKQGTILIKDTVVVNIINNHKWTKPLL